MSTKMKYSTMKPLSYYEDYKEKFIKNNSLKKLFIQFRKCLDFRFTARNFLNEPAPEFEYYFKEYDEFKIIENVMNYVYEIWNERELVNAYMELTNTKLEDNSFLITYETKYKMKKNKQMLMEYIALKKKENTE